MTSYPNDKDKQSYFQVIDGITPIDSALFEKFSSAILAIEQELGTNPSGTYSTVKQRLDTLVVGTGDGYVVEKLHNTITLLTFFVMDWISPEIGGQPVPSLLAKVVIDPKEIDSAETLYLKVITAFYVDFDAQVTISLWDITNAPTEIEEQTFTAGEHIYTIDLDAQTYKNSTLELRCIQQGTVQSPVNINTLFYTSRLIAYFE